MFIGGTDTAFRVAEIVLDERRRDAARERMIRESMEEFGRSERRFSRITIRLPKFDLLGRIPTGRPRTV
ncbi:MAG: hypothetical protein M3Y37_11435 [Chloroflexota bacterium]|nr:hypothetical protein [Chloroflexota bacterium]